eukprot:6209300-Pleurochrysis_carterae.AAC.3
MDWASILRSPQRSRGGRRRIYIKGASGRSSARGIRRLRLELGLSLLSIAAGAPPSAAGGEACCCRICRAPRLNKSRIDERWCSQLCFWRQVAAARLHSATTGTACI